MKPCHKLAQMLEFSQVPVEARYHRYVGEIPASQTTMLHLQTSHKTEQPDLIRTHSVQHLLFTIQNFICAELLEHKINTD